MSDGLVEPRPPNRFYCYRCSIVYEDVQQELNCPFCSGGFVEQVDDSRMSFNFNDANMSNVTDSNTDNSTTGSNGTGTDATGTGTDATGTDSTPQTGERLRPMLNNLGILMAGGRSGTVRNETLMEQLIWMINGARPDSNAVTAGAPFVLVGAPGDYVFGGEGLNSVVAQLLGQLENSGPPPLTREQIAEMPSVPVTAEEAAANTSCSICWENFLLDEKVSHLECEHMFHTICISPWLQLHATCPICRRNLMPEAPPGARQDNNQPRGPPGSLLLRIPPALANTVVVRRRMVLTPGHSSSSTSSTSAGSSTTDSRTPGTDSGDCNTAQYNTDIDYD